MNVFLAAMIGAVTLGTEWQDVPDTNTVGSVVGLVSYVIGNYETVSNRAMAVTDWARGEGVFPVAITNTTVYAGTNSATFVDAHPMGAIDLYWIGANLLFDIYDETALKLTLARNRRATLTFPTLYDWSGIRNGTETLQDALDARLSRVVTVANEAEVALVTITNVADAATNVYALTLPVKGGRLATTDDVPDMANIICNVSNDLETAVATRYPYAQGHALSNQVAVIGGYLNAEDARFVVTNYDSTTAMPEASMEVKIDGAWTNVWREARRWEAFTPEYSAFSNGVVAALDEKADRAWGSYDSSTGEWAPTNYTWISSPCVAVAHGMTYQRVISTGGEVWVLRATDAYTFGGTTNGYFQIYDSDGNCQFEVIKGDKMTVPAEWSTDSFAVTNFSGVNHIYLRYPVVSGTHPTAECATHLEPSLVDWHDETDSAFAFNATWTGSSGDWRLELWPKTGTTTTNAFLRATYVRGGDSKIVNHAAVQLTTLVIGGVSYTVGTATISGSTVLTLTPAP